MPRKADPAKWGCLQQPCPHGHQSVHRKSLGWKVDHSPPAKILRNGKTYLVVPDDLREPSRKKTVQQCLNEYEELTKDTFWSLEIYIYPSGDAPFMGTRKNKSDPLYGWKYHLRASYSISSGGAGTFYRTDDLAEGIQKLIEWLKTLPDIEHWPVSGEGSRVNLGTPNNA